MSEHLHVIITGGTIDSVFDAARDMVVVNDSSSISTYIDTIIRPHFKTTQEIVTMKDSRDISDNIRAEILRSVNKAPTDNILITHGTYTMPDTARYLSEHEIASSKVVVLTGSMYPLQGFSPSDAPFNLGFAIAAACLSKPGVYLAMNGTLFDAQEAVKNVDAGRFVLASEVE